MSVRWDPLLIRRLARELSALLSGAHLRALRLDGAARDLVLTFRERTLLWRLHPSRGHLMLFPPREPAGDALKLTATVKRVSAPEDERLLCLELVPSRGGRRRVHLQMELLGNQWNAILTDGPARRIRHVLVRRGSGPRPLAVGGTYQPPTPVSREGLGGSLTLERWLALLEPLAPEARVRGLVASVAYTSPINAAALLGEAVRDSGSEGRRALEAGWAIWREMALGTVGAGPVLLETDSGPQPYPFPLAGVSARGVDTLLDAFALLGESAEAAGEADPLALLPAPLLTELESAADAALRRITHLQAGLDGLEDADELRSLGNLLLARCAEVPRGATEVELPGFEGGSVAIPLDPELGPHENAEQLYARARRVERARGRLPGLIERARRRSKRLEELLERARHGTATEEEVRALVPSRPAPRGRPARERAEPPYRSWRSSGGLEIRVGKGARQNDELTFHHSAPGDIWLHARHAAGAHVVLRWSRPGNPPKRDLTEAAVLAALHSEARTSAAVPVDWTSRKYIRKPRGSAPGRVVLERARTIFVRPDPSVAERLSWESGEDG